MPEPTQHPDDRGEWARGRHTVEPVKLGHPRWCEPEQCVPLSVDEPVRRQVQLHRGGTVIYGDPTNGELVVGLEQTDDERPVVAVGDATIPLEQAAALAGTLQRLIDLATS